MATESILGLYSRAASAAEGVAALQRVGFSDSSFEILTSSPYPEGAFGEKTTPNRLFLFAPIGAACGFAAGILITVGIQLAYPLVTGGKPLISIPPIMNVMYEGTMLGAILMTVIGVIFEWRLPRFGLGLYDSRITEGYIGLLVRADQASVRQAARVLREAGADEIVYEAGAVELGKPEGRAPAEVRVKEPGEVISQASPPKSLVPAWLNYLIFGAAAIIAIIAAIFGGIRKLLDLLERRKRQ